MKKVCSLLIILLACLTAFAQKQTYDVLTYTLPKGWQQKEVIGARQLMIAENTTGEYAIALLVQSTASGESASDNFGNDWKRLVKTAVTVSGEPAMQAPVNDNGWEIISGNARYTDGAVTGTATLLSATGGGRSAAVVLLTNTNKYQQDLAALISSLVLSKTPGTTTGSNVNSSAAAGFTGLWVDYSVEKNAWNQYTTGYLRKEYSFNADGTYTYRKKNFLTNSANIYFVYETGTYAVKGNQLIITPKRGSAGFWSKAKSLKNNEWGSFVKAENHKLEKISYTFELLEDPNYSNSIIIKPGRATARDGGQFNAPDDPLKFHYAQRKTESLIDNPPGFKK